MWRFGSHLPFRTLFFRTDIYLGQGGTQSNSKQEAERKRKERGGREEKRKKKNLASAALSAVHKNER